MNRMKDVARLLGVELGEIFYIKNRYYKYRLTEKTIEYYDGLDQQWAICPYRILGLLNGEDEIIKKPILNEKEKEYLSVVIKPFRDKVEWVRKFSSPNHRNLEYIKISYQDCTHSNVLNFPDFKVGTMYRGMKIGKSYTLKELGL